MKKIILKKDEFSGFDTLIKLSDSIRCLYKKLAELEMLNKKDSSEYRKYLEYLKMSIEIEKSKYLEYGLNGPNCSKWLEFLKFSCLEDNVVYFDEIILKSSNDYNFIRVANQLTAFKRNLKRKENKFTTQYLEENHTLVVEDSADVRYVEAEIQSDVLKTFIVMLEKCFEKNKTNQFRVNTIYNLANFSSSIEELLLSNDFNIDLSLLTPKSEYFAKLINMNHLFYEKLKDDLIATKVIQELADFTTISDRHIEKHAGEILLRYCYLKSLLFLSSKTQDEALLDMFKSYTNSREYLEEHPHSKQIEQLIDEGFTEVLTKKKELKEHKN